MAATTSNVLKKIIESGGLGLGAYRDAAPPDAHTPFVVITEHITLSLDNDGDGGDPEAVDTAVENVQVDLYEDYLDRSDPARPIVVESYNLSWGLLRLLHRAIPLDPPPWHIYGIRARVSSRSRDLNANLVRTRYSLDVRRSL